MFCLSTKKSGPTGVEGAVSAYSATGRTNIKEEPPPEPLRLQELTFEIKNSSGKNHADVDCSSRSPIQAEPGDEHLAEFPFYSLSAVDKTVDLLNPSPLDSVADIVSAQQSDLFCA